MTLKGKVQRKNTLRGEILEKLITLTGTHGLSQREICDKLGYEKDVLSRVKTEENYIGSPQLLAGLELLKEVIELRKQLAAGKSPLAERLDRIQGELDEIRRLSATPYPEHRPQNFELNEVLEANLGPDEKKALTEALGLILGKANKPGAAS